MSKSMFKLVAIDDDLNFLESLTALLEISGYIVTTFLSVEAAIAGTENDRELFVTLLDHDFSLGNTDGKFGYEFSKHLKRVHWAGVVMPIIYLTGRESKEGFNAAVSEFGGYAPDEYFSKSKLAAQPGELQKRIDFYLDRLANFEASVDEHGIEIAVGQFSDWIE